KGAPDQLLDRCTRIATARSARCLTAADRLQLLAVLDDLAGQGLRPLALAERSLAELLTGELSGQAELVERDLTLLGIVGLFDPPRPEVPAALTECRAAGIRVIMITGDHAGTAAAIAERLGIGDGTTLTGPELERLDDVALAQAVASTSVYARVVPRQKLQLVSALQAQGEIVAMTGDGANDAPALRRSDIGVAMGRRGAAVAKEAAGLVVADDNFATIVVAVEAGAG